MQKLPTWSDDEIIKAFLAGGTSKEAAVNQVMNDFIHYLPTVAKKTGLKKEEALDIFTDAIMDMIDQIVAFKFKGESKLSTYFYKIFYFKCVDLFRKNTTNNIEYREELPEVSDTSLIAPNKIEIEEEIKQLHKYLNQLGEPCKQILLDWGFWGYNMSEIAERIGLESSTQAKDRKYKCLKKLRKLMQQPF
ncbi:MAG: RNA polymerase sigma factor [Saprospiraceae bacterium]